LEIIGKDSCVVNGLPIGETEDVIPVEAEQHAASFVAAGESVILDKDVEIEVDKPPTPCPTSSLPQSSVTPRNPKKWQFKCVHDTLGQKKRELQCELMKLKIYKPKLEVLKLEKELSLPPSEFTKKFSELI